MKRPSIFAFASNDVLRPQLGCIYYDPELEAAICSDGKIMVLDRYEFIPDYSGEVRDRNNMKREERYPNAGALFRGYMMKEKKSYKIDLQKTLKELNECIKAGKKENRERYGKRKVSDYIYYKIKDEESGREYFFLADKLKILLSYTEANFVEINTEGDKILHAKDTMCDALLVAFNAEPNELIAVAPNTYMKDIYNY